MPNKHGKLKHVNLKYGMIRVFTWIKQLQTYSKANMPMVCCGTSSLANAGGTASAYCSDTAISKLEMKSQCSELTCSRKLFKNASRDRLFAKSRNTVYRSSGCALPAVQEAKGERVICKQQWQYYTNYLLVEAEEGAARWVTASTRSSTLVSGALL